ncbi:autotransporter outer membrane beta-barrel domain-containing protein [Chelativorans sp. Marseille-P2723]|uniref:autotransporter family protein n=1 Tax=Chelativorans sp. Marseille-P2723 TaxID=2709133 RepID=UPI00156EF1A6|nr:autotransporter outer membrane beta-barrel domain-containing protein [Chelativorans sp. Marseille-P2723]
MNFSSNRIAVVQGWRTRLFLATTSLVGGTLLSVMDTAPALAQCVISHTGTTTGPVNNGAPINCIEIDSTTVGGDVVNFSIINTPGGPSGLEVGVSVRNGSQVDGKVDNPGTINALSRGIQVDATSTVLGAVSNGGDIEASQAAIEILGTVEGGILNSGNLQGGGLDDGIFVGSGAIIHGGILNTGQINAEEHSIRIDGASEVTGGVVNDAGGVLESRWGIRVLSTSGTIPIFDGGIENHGVITAMQTGISVSQTDAFTGDISNTGSLAGNYGITVLDVGRFEGGIINQDSLSAIQTAIYLSNIDTFEGSILNEASIFVADGPDAVHIENVAAFTGDIVNNGAITDAMQAISVNGSNLAGAIVNDGTLIAFEEGIHVSGGSTIANGISNNGMIIGDVAGIVVEDSALSAITNNGSVTSIGGIAIDLSAANNLVLIEQQDGLLSGDLLLSTGSGTGLAVTGGVIEGNITGQIDTVDISFDLGSGTFSYASDYVITGIGDLGVTSGTVELQGTSDSKTISVHGGTLVIDNLASTSAESTIFSDGTLVVGDSTTPAAKLVSGGTVQIDEGGFLGGYGTVEGNVDNRGTVAVADALARFAGEPGGIFTIDGALTNSGTLNVGGATVGNMLLVAGDYAGADGVLNLNTVLGDDSSATDMLIVQGATSGATSVRVSNRGGTGAQTVEGIKLIDVEGASDGTFTLIGDYVHEGEQAVVAGAYAYMLYQGGTSTPEDGDWYLRSQFIDSNEDGEKEPIIQPGVPTYEAYGNILQGLNSPGSLRQRIGNRTWISTPVPVIRDLKTWPPAEPPAEMLVDEYGLWSRIEGFRGGFKPSRTTSGTHYKESVWKMQVGADAPLREEPGSSLIGGFGAHIGTIAADVLAGSDSGTIETVGYGLGGTLTWYDYSGLYVDGQTQLTWYESDLWSKRADVGQLVDDNRGFGYALGIEAGKRFQREGGWSVTPQAQLSYSEVYYRDFEDVFGSAVSLERRGNLVSRFGVGAEHQHEWRDVAGRISRSHFYGIANLYYDFSDGTRTDVSGVNFVSDNDSFWGGLGFGGAYNWADGRYTLYGEFETKSSLNNFSASYTLGGMVGLRILW